MAMSDRTAVIIIDALGWEMADAHRFDIAGLTERARLRSVLGFSQAALTSILTGAAPDEHGLWMMYSFATARSPFGILGRLGPFGDTRRLWVRNLLRRKLARVDGVTAYYSLYDVPGSILRRLDLPARKATFGPSGGGARKSIIDAAFQEGGVFVRDYGTPEEQAFEELESALETGSTGFNLLYTAGLDSALHDHGPAAPEIGSKLGWYSEKIAGLVSRFPDVRFAVLGDHGMCEVDSHIDLIPVIEAAGLDIPGDYIPFYDSTMARFSIRSEGAADSIRKALGGVRGGRVLGKDEMRELGVNFEGGEFGDMIFLCDPGTIILPSYMGNSPVKGMHGYHPDAPCMFSVMLTNAGFGREEASITDLAGFLLPGFTEGGRP
jgi:hypothetical protein